MFFRLLLTSLIPLGLFAYTPCVMPNIKTLDYELDGDVKVFHLTAERVTQELAPGLIVEAWGYNGSTPGPLIEAVEGDRVRIYVTNHLPEYTTVHWHGILVPCGMDGVASLNQPPIEPGETFVYEFDLRQSGTFMYHPHADDAYQMPMGLMGAFVIHPKEDLHPVERDYLLMLGTWMIPQGGTTPVVTAMGANYFTFNGRAFPGTDPLIAKVGDRVRIRLANVSSQVHPMHLHGHIMKMVGMGADRLPESAQYTLVTVPVPIGETREIEIDHTYPGDWALHCHKVHHLLNGVEGGPPLRMVDVKIPEITQERIRKYFPEYRPIGVTGYGELFEAVPPFYRLPRNFTRFGAPGKFGMLDVNGMFTVFKVREELPEEGKVGWYDFPKGTVAHRVQFNEVPNPAAEHAGD